MERKQDYTSEFWAEAVKVVLTQGLSLAEASIREYIEIFYNRQRRHSRLGNVAPAVFAQNFRIQQRTA